MDKDTLEWPLANAALAVAGIPPDSHDCSLYVDTLKKEAYETMERVAEQQVKEARCPNVIMVAPFSSHVKDPNWQSRLCRRFFGSETCSKSGGAGSTGSNGNRFDVLWLTASPEVLLERKRARGEPRDAAELRSEASRAFFTEAEQKRSPPAGPHLCVDTTSWAGSGEKRRGALVGGAATTTIAAGMPAAAAAVVRAATVLL